MSISYQHAPGKVVLESAGMSFSGVVTDAHVREVLLGADTGMLPPKASSREAGTLRAKLLDLIATHQGDATAVAAAIGVSRATIYRHMQRLGVRTGKRRLSNLLDDRGDHDKEKKSHQSHLSHPRLRISRSTA